MGISDFEKTLFDPKAFGAVEQIMPRVEGAWDLQFPSLRSLQVGAAKRPNGRLKVCIATEDIVGPVRNGGIGTTYAALAQLLAQMGCDTTILYLRGKDVETETIEHWIAFYAAKGIGFTPVPDYAAQENLATNADRWLRAPYNMLRYLRDHPMDVVHSSEWRGSAYLCLLAKRQGLAFADTLFVVKTSSPWMWNRLYGSHTLERLDDLAKITAERGAVELADMVIGGSAHLLRWMGSQGYRLPAGRTFVQPNVVDLGALAHLLAGAQPRGRPRTPIEEIVFFGRLEARKGLFVFCQAIKRLIRLGVTLPPRISFMGKPGARLPARPDQSILEYIREETRGWPTTIQVLTEFQQQEAINSLLTGPRRAVMPSLIENSSLAVYEATLCGIPCVASNVGGNAELVHADDASIILCDPTPRALGDKLIQAVELGGYVARPSFDNVENLETWRWFHRGLEGPLHRALLDRAIPPRPSGAFLGRASVCIYFTGDQQALRATLASLQGQTRSAFEVLIAVDAPSDSAIDAAHAAADQVRAPIRVVDAFDLDAGAAMNAAAAKAGGDALLFLWEGATLSPDALSSLSRCAQTSGAEVLTYLYREPADGVTGESESGDGEIGDGEIGVLRANILGSVTEAFFDAGRSPLPLYVARPVFEALGGFSSDYRVLNHEREFVAKARLAGHHCQTAMLELGSVRPLSAAWLSQMGYDLAASSFRPIRPPLAATPRCLRDLMLASRAGAGRAEGATKRRDAPRRAAGPIGALLLSMLTE